MHSKRVERSARRACLIEAQGEVTTSNTSRTAALGAEVQCYRKSQRDGFSPIRIAHRVSVHADDKAHGTRL